MLDELGSPNTYNHYPTGWAMAFSTPFRMFKRYSLPGRRLRPAGDPLAEGHQGPGRGARPVPPRHRHRADDPRVLRARVPRVRATATSRRRCPGVSMTLLASTTPTRRRTKETQYYAMLGTRGIWHEGWKAVAVHGPTSGLGHFDEDAWQLFHTDVDRSEAHDLAEQHPEKLKRADRRSGSTRRASTTCCRSTTACPSRSSAIARPQAGAAARRRTSTTRARPRCRRRSAANIRGRSYKILADVEHRRRRREGVIFAHGSRFGGHSLFVKDEKLCYVYNFLGIPPEQQFVVRDGLKPGKYVPRHGVHARRRPASTASRTARQALHRSRRSWPRGRMRTQSGMFALCGEGLCVGRD